MNKKDTNHYYADGGYYCSYCNTHTMPYDDFDKYGGHNFCYYQCDCEKGKIEYQMNEEIQLVENQIELIKQKYASKLTIDYDEVNKRQYEIELEKLKCQYGIDQPEYEDYEEGDY